jgi:hypothetical protein
MKQNRVSVQFKLQAKHGHFYHLTRFVIISSDNAFRIIEMCVSVFVTLACGTQMRVGQFLKPRVLAQSIPKPFSKST